jgi:hypothetical protein
MDCQGRPIGELGILPLFYVVISCVIMLLKPIKGIGIHFEQDKRRGRMLIRRIFVLIIAAGIILGCAGTSKKMNKVQLGMTKPEVIAVMGEPNYSSVRDDIEILHYKLTSTSFFTDDYIIRLKQGNVDLLGKRGDFGTLY